MKTFTLASVSLVSAGLLASTFAQAATINMINGNSGEEYWGTAGDWSNGAAPSLDNDYVVNGYQVRSPANIINATFGGGSLTVTGATSSLLLRTQTGGYTATIGTLTIANGATIRNGYSSGSTNANTQILNGTTLTFQGGVTGYTSIQTGGSAGAQASGTGPRNVTINSQILGNGEVRLHDRGTITLNNTASTFSGTWVVGGGANNTSAELTTRLVHGAGAGGFLGQNASVSLRNHSYFDLTHDWTTTGSLTLGVNTSEVAQMKFTNNITVGSLTVAGTSLGTGTYDYTYFAGEGWSNYFDGTTGSITVSAIPEPAHAVLLFSAAALGLVACRRRRS